MKAGSGTVGTVSLPMDQHKVLVQGFLKVKAQALKGVGLERHCRRSLVSMLSCIFLKPHCS